MKKKENQRNEGKWRQIGNFLLGKESNSLGGVLCVRAVSGQWSIRWSEDTYVYTVLTMLMGKGGCDPYIEALLTLFYTATNYAHDFAALVEGKGTPFIDGFTELLNRQTELELSFKKEPSKEEDDAALDEVAEMTALQDELGKLDEDGGAS